MFPKLIKKKPIVLKRLEIFIATAQGEIRVNNIKNMEKQNKKWNKELLYSVCLFILASVAIYLAPSLEILRNGSDTMWCFSYSTMANITLFFVFISLSFSVYLGIKSVDKSSGVSKWLAYLQVIISSFFIVVNLIMLLSSCNVI